MSVTVTKAAADSYFSERIEDNLWTQFDDDDRTKAVQSAKDAINRALGDTVTSETVDTTSQYYPDRAVYHQALYILMNSDAVKNGASTAPKWAGVSKDGEQKKRDPAAICREARRWMDWQSGPTIPLFRG